jgi:hypothetical protein
LVAVADVALRLVVVTRVAVMLPAATVPAVMLPELNVLMVPLLAVTLPALTLVAVSVGVDIPSAEVRTPLFGPPTTLTLFPPTWTWAYATGNVIT